ncbi:MAG: helix-turn-helix domain-containing protein, partial [Anaerolineae bacterium]
AMITIFNGRSREPGEGPESRPYIQVGLEFRELLPQLKGAKLAVLMALALHANKDGWAWPSYETLARETGYNLDTVREALSQLYEMEWNGRRVLLRYQPRRARGEFATNRYLLFPTPEEVERYRNGGVNHRPGPEIQRGDEETPVGGAMITIFNGRSREPGEGPESRPYIQVG